MNKTRGKNTPVIPRSSVFGIPPLHQQTIVVKRFLLMNDVLRRAKECEHLLPCDEQLDLLFSNGIIFMGGTFSTVSSNFNQGKRVFYYLINHIIFITCMIGLPAFFCCLTVYLQLM